jgi:hypothetical protein
MYVPAFAAGTTSEVQLSGQGQPGFSGNQSIRAPELTFIDSNTMRIAYGLTETFRRTRVTSFKRVPPPLKESIEPRLLPPCNITSIRPRILSWIQSKFLTAPRTLLTDDDRNSSWIWTRTRHRVTESPVICPARPPQIVHQQHLEIAPSITKTIC